MTIRDFFENYYDGQGPVCVFSDTRTFMVDQGLASSHTLLPGFLASKLGEKLGNFKVIFYLKHVDLEPDDGSEEKVIWNIGVRRETYARLDILPEEADQSRTGAH